MLTILLALGVLSPGQAPSDVVTPEDRIITISRSGGRFAAAQQIDPSDVVDFVLNLQPVLADTEAFALVAFTVIPSSAALGFTILDSSPFSPEELDDSHVRIWVTIAAPSRGLSAWTGSGTSCAIEITGTTDSNPPRTFQRTATITVVQK